MLNTASESRPCLTSRRCMSGRAGADVWRRPNRAQYYNESDEIQQLRAFRCSRTLPRRISVRQLGERRVGVWNAHARGELYETQPSRLKRRCRHSPASLPTPTSGSRVKLHSVSRAASFPATQDQMQQRVVLLPQIGNCASNAGASTLRHVLACTRFTNASRAGRKSSF